MNQASWTRAEKITLSCWIKKYRAILETRNYSRKTIQNKSAILSALDAQMGAALVTDITPKALLIFINLYRQSGRDSAAQSAFLVIGDLFREAWLDGWVVYSPALPLRVPSGRVKRSRLDFATWERIYETAKTLSRVYMPHAMLLALSTGQRRGDISKMRRSDIFDGHLHVTQQKTGFMLALPLELVCPPLGVSLGEIIERCPGRDYLLGERRVFAHSLSEGFLRARNQAFPDKWSHPPSFHEQRSLAERIYYDAGINTQRLLGHLNRATTDKYNRNRGLDWNYLKINT